MESTGSKDDLPVLLYGQTSIKASVHLGAVVGRNISTSQMPMCHVNVLAQNRPSNRPLDFKVGYLTGRLSHLRCISE